MPKYIVFKYIDGQKVYLESYITEEWTTTVWYAVAFEEELAEKVAADLSNQYHQVVDYERRKL